MMFEVGDVVCGVGDVSVDVLLVDVGVCAALLSLLLEGC